MVTFDEQSKLKSVLNFANIAIWDFEPSSSTMRWCSKAKQLFGLSEITDIHFDVFLSRVHAGDRDRVAQTFTSIMKHDHEAHEIEFRTIELNGGVVRHLKAVGFGQQNLFDGHYSIEGIFRDMTDIRKREKELSDLKNRADAASTAKTQFLANMSHEMRTPLGAILGFAELGLQENASYESQRESLRTIHKNGEVLLNLINEVLDVSRIEANGIVIDRSKFRLRTAVDEVLEMFRYKIEQKNLTVQVQIRDNVPEFIESDQARLKQVLVNLLCNALKFTEVGTITVDVKKREDRRRSDRIGLAIEVTDSGIGISSENQKNLFQRFAQADKTIMQRYGGSGLGLVVSRQLARAMGGDLVLTESAPQLGSTFTYTFDCHVPPPEDNLLIFPPVHTDGSNRSLACLEGVRVLLAEDSPDNQALISLFLKSAGAWVDMVDDGLQALSRVHNAEYDVVLMDIQMPKLDGYAATERLRNSGYKEPIIALTAHAMAGAKEKCLQYGFNDHLAKPIDRAALLREVAHYARKRESRLN